MEGPVALRAQEQQQAVDDEVDEGEVQRAGRRPGRRPDGAVRRLRREVEPNDVLALLQHPPVGAAVDVHAVVMRHGADVGLHPRTDVQATRPDVRGERKPGGGTDVQSGRASEAEVVQHRRDGLPDGLPRT